MIAEIDEMLSYQANRSKWFQDAADSKIKTDEHISINTKMTDLISEIDSIETAIHAYRINPKVLAQLHQSLSSLYYTMNPQEGA